MIAANKITTPHPIHTDLELAMKLLYTPCGFTFGQPEAEAESAAYMACTFRMNGMHVKYRAAKITPTKNGQFVTTWKRNTSGITEPFHVSDDVDLMIIGTRNKELLGQFVFPKPVLLEQGILSATGKEGKRGFRVYPPWDVAANKQAQQTQRWQLQHFIDLSDAASIDLNLAKKLFNTNWFCK